MSASSRITLDLVRHGEVRTPGLLCAPPDEPLSAKGWAQMRTLDAAGTWERIYCSPSLRCSDYARELGEKRGIPVITDPAWREMDFGAWTGQNREHLWNTDQDRLLQLWQQPLEFVAPGGEGLSDFVKRVHSAFSDLLAGHSGKNVLLITHAGVMRAILAKVLGIDHIATQRFSIGHGRINRIRAYDDGEFSLLKWGCKAR